VPGLTGPREHGLAEQASRADAPVLGQDGREPEEPGPGGQRQAAVGRRDLDRASDRGAQHLAVTVRDERREARVVEVVGPLGDRLLVRGEREQREDRRAHLVLRQREVDTGEHRDVVPPGAAHGDPVRRDRGPIERLAAAGDRQALAAVAAYGRKLAVALAAVINLLDPDVIVLGGGLSSLAGLYDLVPRLWAPLIIAAEARTRLVPARFGAESGLRGAAWLPGAAQP